MNGAKETKVTAVVYDTEDARAFLRDRPKADKILALTPNARFVLKDIDIPVIVSTERYTDRDHVRCIARIRRADRQLVAALEKDTVLNAAAKETLRHDVRVAAATIVRLWLTLGKEGDWLIQSSNGWRRTADRLEALGCLNELIAPITVMNRKRPNDTWAKPIFRLFNRLAALCLRSRKPFLVTGYLYGLSDLAQKAVSTGRTPVQIRAGHGRVAELGHTFRSLWLAARGKPGVRLIACGRPNNTAAASLPGILLSIDDPIIRHGLTPLRPAIFQGVLATQSAVAEMCDLISILKPSSLIAHSLRWNDEAALSEAAGMAKIPRILISHGSHTIQHESAAEDEQRLMADGLLVSTLTDVSLVQSPHAEAVAKHVIPKAPLRRSRPVMWGYKPLPQPSAHRPKKRILHAGTYKSIFNYRPVVYETSDEFVCGLVAMVEAVSRIPDAELIIRIRPMPECDIATLKALLPEAPNCRIKTDGSFLEDLADADMLVSFSSTTIEEALHARRPVLLWGGSRRYRHLSARTVSPHADDRGAVYAPTQPSDLEPMIRAILDAHHARPLTNLEQQGHVWSDSDIGADVTVEDLIDGCVVSHSASGRTPNGYSRFSAEQSPHAAAGHL
ncbi:MAG: hypothetical protein RIB59_13015 [Rhodospirillales bacterium]